MGNCPDGDSKRYMVGLASHSELIHLLDVAKQIASDPMVRIHRMPSPESPLMVAEMTPAKANELKVHHGDLIIEEDRQLGF